MNVLFINPYMPIDDMLTIRHPPLGIGYLSTALKSAGHSVFFLDLPMLRREQRETAIRDYLESHDDVFVGITCVTQSYAVALSIAAEVKKLRPSVPVMMGGPHVSFTPEETLSRHWQVDFIVMHDGEDATVALVNAIGSNRQEYYRINGLAYRSDTGVVAVIPCKPPEQNLDRFGFPDRSIFDMQRYLDNDYETVVMTARGCPNRCAFCSTSVMGRKYRVHSVRHVLEEIQNVLALGFQSVFFGDDTFPADPERIMQLCNAIIREGLKFEWTCNMRVMDVKPKLIAKMHEAGMYRTFIGYESFSPEVLHQFRKGSNPSMQKAAAEILREIGVELHASMIIGCSNDTWESVLENVDYLREVIQPTLATFNTIELRPGTDVYLHPEQYGYTLANPLWYEDIHCTDQVHVSTKWLSGQDIRNLCAAAYERFYG